MARNKMIKSLILIGLAAVAFTGCSSDDNPASPGIVDNAPPAIPANVSADLDGTAVNVAWDANTVDTDLAGYVVERENYGQTTVLTASPISAVSYVDASPAMGSNIYRVYAVDNAGNQSAVATSLVIITTTHTPAEPGSL
ncbi:hypothetical protein DRQ50_06850 [bacterium]|nr:MAG: hypothetical protein DRQ50_06850 [bacterium]